MPSHPFTQDELAIIDRLSPEALRLFFETFDAGLEIHSLDVAQLRKRLLDAPPDDVRTALRSPSALEVEAICRHQLAQLKTHLTHKVSKVKKDEATIILGHKMLMGIITAASMIAGALGWASYGKFEDAVKNTQALTAEAQQIRQKYADTNASISHTLVALVKAHFISVDQHIREIIDMHESVLALGANARRSLERETRYTDELIENLQFQKSLIESSAIAGGSTKDTTQELLSQLDRLKLIRKFEECLACLTEPAPKRSKLNEVERKWQEFRMVLESDPNRGGVNRAPDELVDRVLAYTNNVLGNVHLQRWLDSDQTETRDLDAAMQDFQSATLAVDGFARAINNMGVVHFYLSSFGSPEERRQHLRQAESALEDVLRLETDPSRQTIARLNRAELRLWQAESLENAAAQKMVDQALQEVEATSAIQHDFQRRLTLCQALIQQHLKRPSTDPSPLEQLRESLEENLRVIRGHFVGTTLAKLKRDMNYHFLAVALEKQIVSEADLRTWTGISD
jgi:hypothetical protein